MGGQEADASSAGTPTPSRSTASGQTCISLNVRLRGLLDLYQESQRRRKKTKKEERTRPERFGVSERERERRLQSPSALHARIQWARAGPGLLCGSFLLKGKLFACVGRNQNLKDLQACRVASPLSASGPRRAVRLSRHKWTALSGPRSPSLLSALP